MARTLAAHAPAMISKGKTNPSSTFPRLNDSPTTAAGRSDSTFRVQSAKGMGRIANDSPRTVPVITATPTYTAPNNIPTTAPVEKIFHRQLSEPASLRAVAPEAATGAYGKGRFSAS